MNNFYCQFCLNKKTTFQISFTESIRLCTNETCCLTSDSIKIESNQLKFNTNEFVNKYGTDINRLNVNELDILIESPTTNIQLLNELNTKFNKLIEIKPIVQIQTQQPIQFEPIEQDLFQFSTDINYDTTLIQNNVPQFNPMQPIQTDTNSQFDDNFFTSIDDLFQNDLTVLEQDYNPIDFQTENAQDSTPSYTELLPINQQELTSNIASNFLYSNDFLDTNQTVNVEPVYDEVIVDARTKSGSSIKITRRNKTKKFCLSPSYSSPTKNQQSIPETSDTPVQLSPDSMDTDTFKTFATNKPVKQNKQNDNLLPWEVSKPRRSIKRLQNDFSTPQMGIKKLDESSSVNRSFKSISNSVSRADLSHKATTQRYDFGKEKGTLLKRLEDSNILSLTKMSSGTLSAKDLVLNVLKKRTAV